MRHWVAAVCLAGALAPIPRAEDNINRSAQVLGDFNRRIADYLKVHKMIQAEMHGLKPTNSPEAIEHYQHRLAHEIREARRQSKPGDIFTPEIAAEFRRLISGTLQGPEARRIRESLRAAAPVVLRGIRVNGTYPEGVPLQSTPPSLLLNLPPLPSDLDYRVVGSDLILRDIDANLIVDYIPKVIS